jgi:hypothetical protein
VSSGKREDSGVEWKARGTQGFSGSGAAKQGFQREKTAKQGPQYSKVLKPGCNGSVRVRVIVRVLVSVSVRDFGST